MITSAYERERLRIYDEHNRCIVALGEAALDGRITAEQADMRISRESLDREAELTELARFWRMP